MKSDIPTLGLFSQLLEKLMEEKAATHTDLAGQQAATGSKQCDPALRPAPASSRQRPGKPAVENRKS